MHRLIVVCLLLTSACNYEDSRCPNYSMAEFEAVEASVRKAYGPVLDEVLNDLELDCSHFIEPLPGELFQIGGIATPPNNIVIRPYPTLRMGAYAHELIHLIKWRQYNTVDPDHATGNGPWKKADDDFILSIWWLW